MKHTYPFAATYEFDGGIWPVIIYAYDYDDAECRCSKLGLTLGSQVSEEIPQLGFDWGRLLMWLAWIVLAGAIVMAFVL